MAQLKRLSAPLGILLVFASMAFGMEQATDFIPVLPSMDPGTTHNPPNNTSNKTT